MAEIQFDETTYAAPRQRVERQSLITALLIKYKIAHDAASAQRVLAAAFVVILLLIFFVWEFLNPQQGPPPLPPVP